MSEVVSGIASLQFSGTRPNGATMTGYVTDTIQVRLLDGKKLDDMRPEMPGHRLVRLGWKGNEKTGREGHAARYVSVAEVAFELEGADRKFIPMLQGAFEEAQKKMIHAAVTERLDRKEVVTALDAADFSKEKVLSAWIAAQESGGTGSGTVSAEDIGNWFDTAVKDNLVITLVEKNGKDISAMTDEDAEPFYRAAAQYRTMMAKLSSIKPTISIDVGKKLQKAMALVEEEKLGFIGKKLAAKLERIVNPDDEGMMMNL